MLIKKLKSSTSVLFAPARSPHTKVEPLREMPGNRASPWDKPIKIEVLGVIFFVLSFLKSATTKKNAEIKNPQINVFVEKLCSNKFLKSKNIIIVGIVDKIKFK